MTMQGLLIKYGALFGHLPPDRQDYCIKEVARIGSQRLKIMMDTLEKAFGFHQPPPLERLRVYIAREQSQPPTPWDLLMEYFPKTYHEQMTDFHNLAQNEQLVARLETLAPMASTTPGAAAPAVPSNNREYIQKGIQKAAARPVIEASTVPASSAQVTAAPQL